MRIETKAHSYKELLVPPFPSELQHPNGPHRSSYSEKEIKDAIWTMRRAHLISANEKDVLLAILDRQGPEGRLDISNEELAKKSAVSVPTLKRILDKLEKNGWITRVHFLPTPTSYRRQMNTRWNFLMISQGIISSLNTTLSSSFNSSSSVLDLKSLDNVVSHKPTACSSFASNLSDSNQLEAVDNKSLVSSEEISPLDTEKRMRKSQVDIELEKSGIVIDSAAAPKKEFKPLISWQDLVGEEENEEDQNVGISAHKLKDPPSRHLEIVRHPWEMEQPITKEKARRERIDDIPNRYSNYEEVLERENCTLAEIKARMRANRDYEPFTKNQKWDLTCHPKYAIMPEKERDRRFIKSVEFWMGEPKHGYRKNIRTMLKKGRKQADSCRAEYGKYVMSIYEHYGLEMELWKFGWKTGWEVYLAWVENGEPRPQNRGYNARQNRELVKREFGRKRKFARRKGLDEEIEEQREALKLEQDEITRAYGL